jgi:hypothetical protein
MVEKWFQSRGCGFLQTVRSAGTAGYATFRFSMTCRKSVASLL